MRGWIDYILIMNLKYKHLAFKFGKNQISHF